MRAALLSLFIALPACSDVIVFKDVNVIAMTSEKVAPKQSVVVRDGKIEAVGARVQAPKGATVIDGSGKYLIPGLAEMHGHVPPMNAPNGAVEDALFLYVANGITTVRGMLGHPGQLELREKSKRGEIVAPNLYLAGPSFNGNSINSPQEAIDRVRAQKKEGWDLLKVHPGLTRDEYDAMARSAREEGIRFGGHVPEEVGLTHAIEMGQETFDHIDGYVEYLDGGKGPVDPVRLAEIVKRSKDAGVWIVPTSALWEVLFNTIPLQTLQSYEELKYVSSNAVDSWVRAYEQRGAQRNAEEAKNVIDNRVRILRALHQGGVRILMGTDAPQQFSVPGFSLHRELLRMRAADMSPYEILRSGTVNVGAYFAKQDSFGTIERGKRADLILLDANPLQDIGNVAKINGVMVRGRWLSRDELDAGLKRIAAKFQRAATVENPEQAIRRRLSEWVAATNSGDHRSANEVWEPGVQGWFPEGAEFSPAAAAEAAGADAASRGTVSYELTIDEVLVSGDLAVVRDTWRETQRFGERAAVRTIKSFEVWRRQNDGRWRIARWISTPERWSKL